MNTKLLTCRTLLALFLAASIFVQPSGAATLVEKGQPRAVIILPEKPSPVAEAAARVLRDHIKQMSGAELPIQREDQIKGPPTPERAWVLVGEGKLTEKRELTSKDLGPGGIFLSARGDVLALFGTDARTPADLHGTRYAVTTFLEDRLGVTLKMNGGHAFGHLWAKYGKDHPDWFALQPDGSRDQSRNPDRARLCKSNPDLIAAIAREKIDELNRNPDLLGVAIGPNDGGRTTFCTCPRCEALDSPKGRKILLTDFSGKTPREFEHVSLTDRTVYFWNAIAEQVSKVHPDKLLVVDAYSAYAAPPVERKLHPNLVVRFAPLGYHSEEYRQESLRDWDGWSKAAKRMYFRPNLMLLGRRDGLPLLYVHKFGADFRYLASHGMMGTDFDSCCHHWATQGLNYYVVARLHWNPAQDVDALVDDYCRAGFGPAAKSVRRYFDKLEALLNEAATGKGKAAEAFTPESVAALRKELDQARREAETDPVVAKRVAFLELGLRWTAIEAKAHTLLSDPKADREAAKRPLDERFLLMKEVFQKTPLGLNVAYISWGEDGLWAKLGWKRP